MATTQNTFNGNGSNLGPFSFTFKWLESTDIKVSVGGVLKTAGTHYNLQGLNYTTKTGGQVLFTAGNAPPVGTGNVRVYRDTDDDVLSATFSSGSAIRAKDLNDNFTQNLYVTQEVNNNAVSIDGSNPMVGNLNMNGFQIDNLAAPTSANDAANKAYVDALATSGGDGDKGDIVVSGSGSTFTIDSEVITNSKVSPTAAIASSKLAFTQSGTGAVARTVDSKLKDVVSVKDFGAVGDGVTDDTAAIQAALNAHKCVYFPEGQYLVTTINPGDEAHLLGAGKYRSEILGKIVCGDGSGSIREIELSHLSVDSTGNPYAVTFNLCPDFRIFDCEIKGGVNILFSVRGAILNSDITTSGSANWAIRTADYANGLVIRDNVITGGTTGGAINVRGPLTVGTITGNIIESSYHGIWVANEAIVSGIDAGACTNVQITNNYIEQCSTPIKLGAVFKCTNFTVTGNYIGNSETSVISARTSAFWLGRLVNSLFAENNVALANTIENFIEWNINSIAPDNEGNILRNNKYSNTPANIFLLSGTGAATTSFQRKLGGTNFIDFLKIVSVSGQSVSAGLSSTESRQWISPTFTANASVAQSAWLLGSELELGGYILKIELIDCTGTLTGCRLRIGDTSQNNRVLDIADLSTVSLTNGSANLNTTGSVFASTIHNTYLVTAGAGTGTFRVRITYRAS